MAVISKPYTFVNNTTIDPTQVNADFDAIINELNGGLDNANIDPSAAIAESKLAFNISTGHKHDGVDSRLIEIATNLSFASVYLSANQTITNGVITKINFNTEAADVASEFDPVTNYRFTASKAGRYLVTAMLIMSALVGGKSLVVMVYKNGSAMRQMLAQSANDAVTQVLFVETITLALGDYIEFYVIHDDTVSHELSSGTTGSAVTIQRLS